MTVITLKRGEQGRPQMIFPGKGGGDTLTTTLRRIALRQSTSVLAPRQLVTAQPMLHELQYALEVEDRYAQPGPLAWAHNLWLANGENVKGEVLEHIRDAHAASFLLGVIGKYFPTELAAVPYGSDWWRTYTHLLDLVERTGWFPIDAGIVIDTYNDWMATGDDETLDWLMETIEYIPIEQFIPHEYDLENEPTLRILMGLLVHEVYLEDTDLRDFGIEDTEITEVEPGDIAYRITNLADFSNVGEPLKFLPDLCRVWNHDIKNALLNNERDPDYNFDGFSWDKDVERLRIAWQTAKAMALRTKALWEWVLQDPAHAYSAIALTLFIGGYIEFPLEVDTPWPTVTP